MQKHFWSRSCSGFLAATALLVAPAFVGCGGDNHPQTHSAVQCILDVSAELSPAEVDRLLDDAMNNLPSDLACDGAVEPGSEVDLIARQSGVDVAERRFWSGRNPGGPAVHIP